MKSSIIAFMFSALIGVGFHYSAAAAPKKEAAEEAPEQGGGSCADLEKEYAAAETAAEAVCKKDEEAPACEAAYEALDAFEQKFEDAKCEGEEEEGEGEEDEEEGEEEEGDEEEDDND